MGWGSEWDPEGFASGGGFSNYTMRAKEAKWQQEAVAAYLSRQSGLPPAGWFNEAGRATPDIAAFAHNHAVVSTPTSAAGPGSGTSAACPTAAALIGLANAARHRAGKPPLGPLNPLLYSLYASHPQAFTDITEGSNAWPPLGSEGAYGFTATAGWDAVTGLGSLRLDKLLAAMEERGI